MKIIKFQGGLGNQMFQYALYKSLKSRFSNVKAELFHYSECEYARKFELESFGIKLDECSKKEIDRFFHYNEHNYFPLYRLWRFFWRKYNQKTKRFYPEKKDGEFDQDVLSVKDSYLDGYWQNENYFSSVRNELIEDFSFEELKISEEYKKILGVFKECNSVSVHVRRGDYLNTPEMYCGVCTPKYYENAMEYVRNHVDSPRFFLFTDDPEWAHENFGNKVTVVHDDNLKTGIMDMFMMTQCRHNIIANSSFSWWGAWLNQNPDKIVVAPEKWFANSESSGQICDGWVKVSGK